MIDTVKKAFWLLKKRPQHFIGTIGQYWRFSKARFLSRFWLTPELGVSLAENVRIQNVGCLIAERPDAHIKVGRDSVIYEKAQIEAYGKGQIEIGPSSIMGEVRIYSRMSIKLGQRVVTSWNVFIQDFDPHPLEPELRALQMRHMVENFRPAYRARENVPPLDWSFPCAPIEIGDDVWLGANATVLKGAKIGNGCIVATGAVVTAGIYPDRSILAGAPARVVKTLA